MRGTRGGNTGAGGRRARSVGSRCPIGRAAGSGASGQGHVHQSPPPGSAITAPPPADAGAGARRHRLGHGCGCIYPSDRWQRNRAHAQPNRLLGVGPPTPSELSPSRRRSWPRSQAALNQALPAIACDSDMNAMCTHSWLSLTCDTGGEVFGRIEVATPKSAGRPKGRRTGDLKPTSAIVGTLAVSESACSGNSPPVSKMILVAKRLSDATSRKRSACDDQNWPTRAVERFWRADGPTPADACRSVRGIRHQYQK